MRLLLTVFICVFSASIMARTWTNSQGKTMEAKLVKISTKDDTVTLKQDKNGKEIVCSIAKLSKADQDYVNSVIDSKREANRPKTAKEKTDDFIWWIVVLALCNIPVYFIYGTVFFKGWADFLECIKFWLTPDIISLFRGEFMEDRIAEWKLGFFLLACGITVFAEYFFIHKYFIS